MGLHKMKWLLLYKGNNWQREKLAFRIGEDMCKLVTWKESVSRIGKKDTEYQKSRQSNQQTDESSQKLPNWQKVHEKMYML